MKNSHLLYLRYDRENLVSPGSCQDTKGANSIQQENTQMELTLSIEKTKGAYSIQRERRRGKGELSRIIHEFICDRLLNFYMLDKLLYALTL